MDEDVSQGNNAAVPSFEQEREMYGRPKRVKKGDLEKYVTRNYDEAQSGSAGTFSDLSGCISFSCRSPRTVSPLFDLLCNGICSITGE